MRESIANVLDVRPNLKGSEIAAILGWNKKEIKFIPSAAY